MNKVINCGSLNIDHVYRVDHIVVPGETLSSSSYERYCGGKGANQSIALARAGVEAIHLGCIGMDGLFLKEELQASGVDTEFVFSAKVPTGHAVIQVADNGENSIVLFPGANRAITKEQLDKALVSAAPGDILLLQNETNINELAMNKAFDLGMEVCLNPAPCDDSIKDLSLEKVRILILNEIEGATLAGGGVGGNDILERLSKLLPQATIVMTLGEKGVLCTDNCRVIQVFGLKVEALDTTAAGDTFTGYFLAGRLRGMSLEDSLEFACKAAALCVTRHGAAVSIPYVDEVM